MQRERQAATGAALPAIARLPWQHGLGGLRRFSGRVREGHAREGGRGGDDGSASASGAWCCWRVTSRVSLDCGGHSHRAPQAVGAARPG